jgi:3'(2'), 5'-bisphosphate nucleotidase
LIDFSPLIPAVRQAVALTRLVRQLALAHSDKGGNDPVTIADYGAQALLLRALSRLYPDAAVLAEEHSEQFLELVSSDARRTIVELVGKTLGESVHERDLLAWLDFGRDRQADIMWTVDPIDGTRGYVHGRRYCVAVGVLHQHEPVDGLLACPGYPSADGDGLLLYTSGGAAFAEGMAGGAARRLQVRDETDAARLQLVESTDNADYDHAALLHLYAALGIEQPDFIRIDGQDKYATVAAGDADFYVRPERPHDRYHYIWDHAAGAALVKAAGGMVSDLQGNALDFSHGERLPTLGVVVSSAVLHERLLDAVQAMMSAQALT